MNHIKKNLFSFFLKRSKPKFDQNDRQELVEMIHNELEFSLKWNKGICRSILLTDIFQLIQLNQNEIHKTPSSTQRTETTGYLNGVEVKL